MGRQIPSPLPIKYRWTTVATHSVNWVTIALTMQVTSKSEHTFYFKLVHDILPTMKQQLRFMYNCRCCPHQRESIGHMLRCQLPRKKSKQEWSIFKSSLNKAEPPILDCSLHIEHQAIEPIPLDSSSDLDCLAPILPQ